MPSSKIEARKAARVRWDANPQHDEHVTEPYLSLLPTRLNKSVEGAWRLIVGAGLDPLGL
eukprot:4835483-Pleurochrysis_carterae.AAC.1